MKILMNGLLVGLIAFLAFLLYNSINEPIKFESFKKERQSVVVERLKDIREVQAIYKEIVGIYANNFDTLLHVINNDSIPHEVIEGDPDDIDNMDKVTRTMFYYSARDSVKAMGIDMKKLRFIPFSNNKDFAIQADTIEYQSTKVPVLEVGARWVDFMGEYGDIRFSKYDQQYDPSNMLKFGDMNKPVSSGNWE